MSFVDVGTTSRRSMTKTRALRIWEAWKGHCCLCGEPIEGARDDWFIEHIRALELGGEDVDANCGPAHYACKPEKDAADHSAAARAKRQKQHHLGIKDPNRRRLPGSRQDYRKVTWDSQGRRVIVHRVTGEILSGGDR